MLKSFKKIGQKYSDTKLNFVYVYEKNYDVDEEGKMLRFLTGVSR